MTGLELLHWFVLLVKIGILTFAVIQIIKLIRTP
jgi:hypothetical protein